MRDYSHLRCASVVRQDDNIIRLRKWENRQMLKELKILHKERLKNRNVVVTLPVPPNAGSSRLTYTSGLKKMILRRIEGRNFTPDEPIKPTRQY